LERLYAPGRYLMHTVQMASAYLVHMAPASTITICAAFQMGDSLRWVSRIAYRTQELAKHYPDKGFGKNERRFWEDDEAWQGFRELMERVLVAYDWAETFAALNVVAKPAIDEAFLRQLGAAAEAHGDMLLKMLADAQLRDSERSRRWTAELVRFALQKEGNRQVLKDWARKWVPLADKAMATFCASLPDLPGAANTAREGALAFRKSLGLPV
jgi:toluene monooxygenase system protein E